MTRSMSRRQFSVRLAAAGAMAAASRSALSAYPAYETIRLGIIGLGNRGDQLIDAFKPQPDASEPFVLKRGTTVIEMARAVHKDFAEKLNYARLWRGTDYTGQMVPREFVLEDEDICELHL